MREPRLSNQRIGTIAIRVAAAAGEVDQLDVEDDARDPLPREQVLRRRSPEPLEPALGVLHRPDDPDRGEQVEHLPEQSAVARLRRAHVRPIGLDARPEGHVVVAERGDEQRDLVGWRRHVGVGEDDKVAGGGQHAGTDRGALPAVRHALDTQRHAGDGTCGLGPRLDDVDRGVRAAVVDDEDLDLFGEGGRARRAIARVLVAAAQVPEQLVEGRADPFRLVERGEHQGQAHRSRPS